jgi:dihydroorotate dehydrogenase electron transfer subunit
MTTTHNNTHRDTILLEDAVVVDQQEWSGGQFVLTIAAPRIAARATPGSFVHLTCSPTRPMRRPLSIQRVRPQEGHVEILYKIVGEGLKALSEARPGSSLSCLGPIGNGFVADATRPLTLLLGGGVGMPPMIFLAEQLANRADEGFRPLVLLGSELPFPFHPQTVVSGVPGIPVIAKAAMPLLESWGVPSRLASRSGQPGCFPGFVTELADAWLRELPSADLSRVEIFACGPTPMLAATAELARRHGVACQVSLEEYMACAVGGCAGCAVRVMTPTGPAMKRVCVDGPVFDSRQVFPEPA